MICQPISCQCAAFWFRKTVRRNEYIFLFRASLHPYSLQLLAENIFKPEKFHSHPRCPSVPSADSSWSESLRHSNPNLVIVSLRWKRKTISAMWYWCSYNLFFFVVIINSRRNLRPAICNYVPSHIHLQIENKICYIRNCPKCWFIHFKSISKRINDIVKDGVGTKNIISRDKWDI